MRAAIVMAAGASRRFGRSDKLQARIAGRSLLDHALDNALAAVTGRVLLVAPTAHPGRRVTLVRSPRGKPLSHSLTAGLRALRPIEREVLIFLGDMPFARAPRMRLGLAKAVRPTHSGLPGHPMLVRSRAARAASRAGDTGLAARLKPRTIRGVAGNVIDIDTPAALQWARLHGSRSFRLRS